MVDDGALIKTDIRRHRFAFAAGQIIQTNDLMTELDQFGRHRVTDKTGTAGDE